VSEWNGLVAEMVVRLGQSIGGGEVMLIFLKVLSSFIFFSFFLSKLKFISF
jgi:hypothetical protein